jgi:hypothetical protein
VIGDRARSAGVTYADEGAKLSQEAFTANLASMPRKDPRGGEFARGTEGIAPTRRVSGCERTGMVRAYSNRSTLIFFRFVTDVDKKAENTDRLPPI